MKIFTFEGIDGAGKTSTMEAVAQRLRAAEYPVRTIAFPSVNAGENASPMAQTLAYVLDQRTVMDDLAKDLTQPGVLLIDRFYDSTIAYQGVLGDESKIFRIIVSALIDIRIEKTFWLDVPVSVAVDRINKRGELADPGFLTRVHSRYAALAVTTGHRIRRIDATQPFDETVNQVFRVITNRLIKEGL